MSLPISPMEAIEIVQKAVALYKKIQDAPEQVAKIGKRMERLEHYLRGLQELLNAKSSNTLASLQPAQTQQLKLVIQDIKSDSQQIYDILYKWDNNVGPFGLELRFKTMAQALFATGSSPDKLNDLCESIQQHQSELRDFLQLLGWFGLNQILVANQASSLEKSSAGASKKASESAAEKDPVKVPAQAFAKNPGKAPAKAPAKTSAKAPVQSAAKLPAKPPVQTSEKTLEKASEKAGKKDPEKALAKTSTKVPAKTFPPSLLVTPSNPIGLDYSIIFVDAHNLGRSRVAEAHVELLPQ
ncbi:hypothetical protein EJ06DRAFT_518213 [Trichodelitschia bisporula]|uniref:Uncharacterized protein n=1 Tax=Trichodelitschia bisporula TaxID=703511 RepID=A0A6G1IAP4_9PEZI|nr:hypothetical protein EJ06DRAFT_518213 [Trichodelitschia bisporula]